MEKGLTTKVSAGTPARLIYDCEDASSFEITLNKDVEFNLESLLDIQMCCCGECDEYITIFIIDSDLGIYLAIGSGKASRLDSLWCIDHSENGKS